MSENLTDKLKEESWYAKLSEDGEDLHIVSEQRGLVATLEAWMEKPSEAESGWAEGLLIAAAPELLAAAKRVLAMKGISFDATSALKEAVDKAEGRTTS